MRDIITTHESQMQDRDSILHKEFDFIIEEFKKLTPQNSELLDNIQRFLETCDNVSIARVTRHRNGVETLETEWSKDHVYGTITWDRRYTVVHESRSRAPQNGSEWGGKTEQWLTFSTTVETLVKGEFPCISYGIRKERRDTYAEWEEVFSVSDQIDQDREERRKRQERLDEIYWQRQEEEEKEEDWEEEEEEEEEEEKVIVSSKEVTLGDLFGDVFSQIETGRRKRK